jgi:hypothetical protein
MLPATIEGREMNLRRFGSAVALAALLALALGVGTAGATASFATKVKIDEGGPKGASGHVSSKQKKCLRDRRVTLLVEDEATGELDKIGTTTTNRQGEWEVDVDLFAGKYVAKVISRIIYLHGMSYTCRGGISLETRL